MRITIEEQRLRRHDEDTWDEVCDIEADDDITLTEALDETGFGQLSGYEWTLVPGTRGRSYTAEVGDTRYHAKVQRDGGIWKEVG